MQVDIWSDVRCPFCYIGKRKFEAALQQFEHKDKVEVEWHSFQLDPTIAADSNQSIIDYFVQVKNVSAEQARQMFSGAQKMGVDAGLKMDLENTIVANSFKAHQLIQMAKEKGKANEIEEALFEVHFTDVKNINDEEVLIATATAVGLDEAEVREALDTEKYAYAVNQDEMQARNIGVSGVPFFVFDNKYAVSGAQPEEAFLQTMEKVMEETN